MARTTGIHNIPSTIYLKAILKSIRIKICTVQNILAIWFLKNRIHSGLAVFLLWGMRLRAEIVCHLISTETSCLEISLSFPSSPLPLLPSVVFLFSSYHIRASNIVCHGLLLLLLTVKLFLLVVRSFSLCVTCSGIRLTRYSSKSEWSYESSN